VQWGAQWTGKREAGQPPEECFASPLVGAFANWMGRKNVTGDTQEEPKRKHPVPPWATRRCRELFAESFLLCGKTLAHRNSCKATMTVVGDTSFIHLW